MLSFDGVRRGELLFYPESFKDQLAENLSIIANFAKSLFWKAEENLHYVFSGSVLNELSPNHVRVYEIVKRVLIAPFALAATIILIPIAVIGHCLTGVSNCLHSREFVYLEGSGSLTGHLKIMHFNTCMLAGGLPFLFGGVRSAGERLNELIPRILEEDPDILFLCEFSETMTPRLFKSLKTKYKHFFVNIGSNACGMDASLSVLSKVPLINAPEFIPSRIEAQGEQKFFYRGYFIMETENCSFLYTHLHPKSTPLATRIRQRQLKEILDLIEHKGQETPWIVLGDLNINRGSSQHEEMKNLGFVDEIENAHGIIPTSAEGLSEGKVKYEESLDYFLTLKGKPIPMETKVIDTYSNPGAALSDHKAIVANIMV